MITYWFIYLVPVGALFIPKKGFRSLHRLLCLFVFVLFSIFIGFRHEVGGDWQSYLQMYDAAVGVPLVEAFATTDPGYAALNWFSGLFGFGIYGTNVLCAILFLFGFFNYARQQPLPWLAVCIAVPYTITVVVMGYSRQGVALGFTFWALASLHRSEEFLAILKIILASLFHKTAVILLPLIIFSGKMKTWRKIVFATLLFGFALYYLILDSVDGMLKSYVEDGMQSDGGGMRITMNIVPSVLLLLSYRAKRLHRLFAVNSFYVYTSALSILLVPFLSLASTLVDRFALYLTPIQIFVWCRFPFLFRDDFFRILAICAVLVVYACVFGVWLNYGHHATEWVPYNNILWPTR